MSFSRLPRELIDEIDSLIEGNTGRRAFARACRTTRRKIPQLATILSCLSNRSPPNVYFIFENLYDGGRKYIKLMRRCQGGVARLMMACLDDPVIIEKYTRKLEQNSQEQYWKIVKEMDKFIMPYAIILNRKNIMRETMINYQDCGAQMCTCAQLAVEHENYTMLELMREFKRTHYIKYYDAMIHNKLRVLQWMRPFARPVNTGLTRGQFVGLMMNRPDLNSTDPRDRIGIECHNWAMANWSEYAQYV